jgi:hypothetical protein
MNDHRTYSALTALIFLVVGLAHLTRAALGWPLSIGAVAIPVALSWIVGLGALALAGWGISLRRAG